MKRVKRIMSVILLILLLLVVGYMCHTCSRLNGNTPIEEFEYTSYCSQDETTTLIISNEYAGEYTTEGTRYVLEFVKFEDGILRFKCEETEYLFTVLDDGDLFDANTNKLLIRSNLNEEKNDSV